MGIWAPPADYRKPFLRFLRTTTLIGLLGLVCYSSHGQTVRYVDVGGTDVGDCSSSACSSIGYAVSHSASGDEIHVGPGTYTESGLQVDRNLILRGTGSEATFVQAASSPAFDASSLSSRRSETDTARLEKAISERASAVREWSRGRRRAEISRAEFIAFKTSLPRLPDGNARRGSEAAGVPAKTSAVGSVVSVSEGVTAEISALTLRHGHATNGGGVYNGGTLTLKDVVVSHNRAAQGSGVFNDGELLLEDSHVVLNEGGPGGGAEVGGGGLYNTGDASLVNSTVATNNVEDYVALGGGIYNAGTLSIAGSSIEDNGAFTDDDTYASGGGIYTAGPTTIHNSSVSRNFVGGSGDASGAGAIDNSADLTLDAAVVDGNASDRGGAAGILSFSGDVLVLNSALTNNTCLDNSALAISCADAGECKVVNTTVSGNGCGEADTFNSAVDGVTLVSSTVANNQSIGVQSSSVKSSIVADNSVNVGGTGEPTGWDCLTVASYGYNVIGDTTGCTRTEEENFGTDQLGINPLLNLLEDNGGPTFTHALFPTSPAIDAGSCTDISGETISFDQRGEPRNDASCDVGAYEVQSSCDIDWLLSMTLMDGGAGAGVLSMGHGAGMTDGLDACEEAELPPVPPTGSFDARLILPDGVTASLADYRSSDSTNSFWKIRFQPGAEGYPFTFHWNFSEDTPTGTYTLRDDVTGDLVRVDMSTTDTYTLSNEGISTLVVEYREASAVSVNYHASWNLISVPVEALDMSLTSLFPEAVSGAFAFQAGYVLTDNLSTGEGYWLKFAADGTTDVIGQRVSQQDIEVAAGWNIVGPFDSSVPVDNISSTPEGIISSSFFGYAGGYSTATVLEPGTGYWVKVASDGVLHLGANGKGAGLASEASATAGPRLVFEDAVGNRGTLYLTRKPIDEIAYALPPVPPSGIFDVRFGDDLFAASVDTDQNEVRLRSAVYPVSIRAEAFETLGVRLRDSIDGSLLDAFIVDGSTTVLSDPIERLVLTTGGELPDQYVLHQNYPNPFNPTTTIEYALPQASEVSLVLYDILGREVQTLLSGRVSAGHQRFVLDGSRLSSGTYIYRLTAGDFSDVRRLVLLK